MEVYKSGRGLDGGTLEAWMGQLGHTIDDASRKRMRTMPEALGQQ